MDDNTNKKVNLEFNLYHWKLVVFIPMVIKVACVENLIRYTLWHTINAIFYFNDIASLLLKEKCRYLHPT